MGVFPDLYPGCVSDNSAQPVDGTERYLLD